MTKELAERIELAGGFHRLVSHAKQEVCLQTHEV